MAGSGALYGGISAGVASVIGSAWGTSTALGAKAGRALAHGITRSAITKAQGGRWSAGFWSGFASSALGGQIAKASSFEGQTAMAAIVGGTASSLGGGKFANGAVTGAFVHMYNYTAHESKYLPKSGNSAEKNSFILRVVNSTARFIYSAGDVIVEAVKGGFNGLNQLINLDTMQQNNMAAAPFVHILKTSKYKNDFALRGSNKVLDSAKYFNPTTLHNSANSAVSKYNDFGGLE